MIKCKHCFLGFPFLFFWYSSVKEIFMKFCITELGAQFQHPEFQQKGRVDLLIWKNGSHRAYYVNVHLHATSPLADPAGPNSFVFAYISAEKHPSQRSVTPNRKSWIRHCSHSPPLTWWLLHVETMVIVFAHLVVRTDRKVNFILMSMWNKFWNSRHLGESNCKTFCAKSSKAALWNILLCLHTLVEYKAHTFLATSCNCIGPP